MSVAMRKMLLSFARSLATIRWRDFYAAGVSGFKGDRRMSVSLNTLEMTPEERAGCHGVISRMAYFEWLDAGKPPGRELDLWLHAERRWIEHDYVPRRPLDGDAPRDRWRA